MAQTFNPPPLDSVEEGDEFVPPPLDSEESGFTPPPLESLDEDRLSIGEELKRSGIRGTSQIVRALAQTANFVLRNNLITGQAMKQLDLESMPSVDIADTAAKKMGEKYPESKGIETFAPLNAQWWAARGPEVGAQFLAAVGVGLATKNPALAFGFGGAQEFGSVRSDALDYWKEQGANDEEANKLADIEATAFGLPAALIEKIPIEKALEKIPGVESGKRTLLANLRQRLFRGAKTAVAEAVTEPIQGTLEDLGALTFRDEEIDPHEFMLKRAAEATLGFASGQVGGSIESPFSEEDQKEIDKVQEALKAQEIGPETLKATLQAQEEASLDQAESVIDEPNQVVQSPVDEQTQAETPTGAQLQPGGSGVSEGNAVRPEPGENIAGDSTGVLSKEGTVLSDELENQTNWGQLSADVQESLDNIQNPNLSQEETDSWNNEFYHLAGSVLRSQGIKFQQLPKVETPSGELVPDLSSPQFLQLQAQAFDAIRGLSEKARAAGKPLNFQASIGGESITHVGKNEVVKVIKPGREGYQATQPEFVEEGKVYVNLSDGTKESLIQKVEAMNSLPGMVPVKLTKDDKGRSVLIQKKIGGRNAIDIEITRWANKNGAVEVKKSSDSADRRVFVMQDANGKPWLVMDIGGDNVKTDKGVTHVIDPVVAPLTPEVAQKLGLKPKEAPPSIKKKQSEPAAPTAKRESPVRSTTTAPKVISKAVNEGRIYGISIKNSEKVQDLTSEETDHLFDAMKIIAPLLKKFGIESITLGDESARMYQKGKTIFLNPVALSQTISTLLAGGRNANEVTRLTAHEEVAHLLHDIVEKESGVSHQKGYESMSARDREETAKIYDLNNSQKTGAQWLERAESKKISAAERNSARQYIFKEYVRQQVLP